MGLLFPNSGDTAAIAIAVISHNDIIRLKLIVTKMLTGRAVSQFELRQSATKEVKSTVQAPVITGATWLGKRGGIDQ